MSKITASADSVGDWGSKSRARQVAANWNTYIAPQLAKMQERYENDERNSPLDHYAHEAWSNFANSGGTVRAAKKCAAAIKRGL